MRSNVLGVVHATTMAYCSERPLVAQPRPYCALVVSGLVGRIVVSGLVGKIVVSGLVGRIVVSGLVCRSMRVVD